MLLGREPELTRIDQLLDAVRRGTSEALLIRGDAGIGKSALVDVAVDRAEGMWVLRTNGIDSEAEIAYAGLLALTQPIRHLLDRLPEPQADALGSALGLRRPLPADRFTVYAGLLSLLGAAADDGPLLIAVDDLQWLDASSREAVVFVARRLGNEGIGLIISERTDSGESYASDLPSITLAGLDRASAAALLTSTDVSLEPSVMRQVLDTVAGNPLALEEVPSVLTTAQRAGREPLDEPMLVGAGVQRSFLRRVRALPEVTQWALLLAAAADSLALEPVRRALEAGSCTLGVFEPAETSGLVRLGDAAVVFRHSLVRSAVYHDASASQRRHAHRVLAKVHADAGDAARWAIHIAQATVVPDRAIADGLASAAGAALQRAGAVSAGRMFIAAARLTPDADLQTERMLEAARALAAGGAIGQALETIEQVEGRHMAETIAADVELLRAELMAYRAPTVPEIARLTSSAERFATLSPPHAAGLLSIACYLSLQGAHLARAAEIGGRAFEMACGVGGLPKLAAASGYAQALMLTGRHSDARPILDDLRTLATAEASSLSTASPAGVAGFDLMIDEAFADARAILDRIAAAARAISAPSLLPFTLATSAEVRLRTGDWTAAYAEAEEADRLARETLQENVGGYALAVRARVEALQGRDEAARRHAARALESAARYGTRSLFVYASAALGQLALGQGAVDEAIAHLERTAAHALDFGLREPNVVHWEPDLVEAYLRAGRIADAERRLESFEELATLSQRRWAKATAARCRAAITGEDLDEAFGRAEVLAEALANPYELARTRLLYGERLRRSGQRGEASRVLGLAAAGFERLGARPWAERASAELAAIGERRNPARDILTDLTPQELQVALAVGRGATNREAAATLFLTVKTIEFHLHNVYQKLDIRSRTKLVLWLARREQVAA